MTSSSHYWQGDRLDEDEDLNHEFKAVHRTSNPVSRIVEYAAKYANAFMNASGGILYLGVEDDGLVFGVALTRDHRDRIRLELDSAIERFWPAVDPDLVRLDFVPVKIREGNEPLKQEHIAFPSSKKGSNHTPSKKALAQGAAFSTQPDPESSSALTTGTLVEEDPVFVKSNLDKSSAFATSHSLHPDVATLCIVEVHVSKGRAPVYLINKDKGTGFIRRNGSAYKLPMEVIVQRLTASGLSSMGINGNRHYTLDPPPAAFTGRKSELASAASWISNCPGPLKIISIFGPGGIGKTALACAVAKEVASSYPDGAITVKLRGGQMGTGKPPMTPTEAMTFVIRLFHPAISMPNSPSEIEAFYLSIFHTRQIILLLDSATDTEQITPLLPRTPTLVLITSHSRLSLDDDRADVLELPLSELSIGAARSVLQALSGSKITIQQADALAHAVGAHPLALKVVAGALSKSSTLTPSALIDRLQSAGSQALLKLEGSKLTSTLKASLSILDDALQDQFLALSLFPGSFDEPAAAALWDRHEGDAGDILDALVANSFLEWSSERGRYRLHDVMRVFAVSNAKARHDLDELHSRFCSHYLGVLNKAELMYSSGGEGLLTAGQIFDSELGNILESIRIAHQTTSHSAIAFAFAGARLFSSRIHPVARQLRLYTSLLLSQNKDLDDIGPELKQASLPAPSLLEKPDCPPDTTAQLPSSWSPEQLLNHLVSEDPTDPSLSDLVPVELTVPKSPPPPPSSSSSSSTSSSSVPDSELADASTASSSQESPGKSSHAPTFKVAPMKSLTLPGAKASIVAALGRAKPSVVEQVFHNAFLTNLLGRAYSRAGWYERAEQCFDSAAVVLESLSVLTARGAPSTARVNPGEASSVLASVLNNVGEMWFDTCAFSSAATVLTRALAHREAAMASCSHEKAAVQAQRLEELTETLLAMGRTELEVSALCDAEARFKRVIELSGDGDQGRRAQAMDSLGKLRTSQGNFIEGEALLREALEIKAAVWGTQHVQYAETKHQLGKALAVVGRYDESAREYEAALEIRTHAYGGTGHPAVAATQRHLGFLYFYTGDFPRGEALFLEALETMLKAVGPFHIEVAVLLNDLALLYNHSGRLSQSEPLLLRSLAIRQKLYPDNHPYIAIAYNNLANLYRKLKESERALVYYDRALDIRLAAFGEKHPETARTLHNIGALHLQSRRSNATSKSYLDRALAIRTEILHSKHPEVATTLSALGHLAVASRNFDEAEAIFQRALEINTDAFGEGNLTVATSLSNLGTYYQQRGRFKDGIELLYRALRIIERTFPTENTGSSRSNESDPPAEDGDPIDSGSQSETTSQMPQRDPVHPRVSKMLWQVLSCRRAWASALIKAGDAKGAIRELTRAALCCERIGPAQATQWKDIHRRIWILNRHGVSGFSSGGTPRGHHKSSYRLSLTNSPTAASGSESFAESPVPNQKGKRTRRGNRKRGRGAPTADPPQEEQPSTWWGDESAVSDMFGGTGDHFSSTSEKTQAVPSASISVPSLPLNPKSPPAIVISPPVSPNGADLDAVPFPSKPGDSCSSPSKINEDDATTPSTHFEPSWPSWTIGAAVAGGLLFAGAVGWWMGSRPNSSSRHRRPRRNPRR